MNADSNKSEGLSIKTLPQREVAIIDAEIDSRELFQSERELRIRHGDDTYRLRLTALNKLILTK